MPAVVSSSSVSPASSANTWAGRQRPQFALARFLVPVLGDANLPFLAPVDAIAVGLEVGDIGLRVAALEVGRRDQFLDEAEIAVAPVNFDGGRVELHRERVAHRLDADVLLEIVVVQVVGADAEDAKPTLDRLLVGDVVRLLGVAHRFDVAAQPLHDFGQARVGFLDPAHLALRPRLALLVDDLPDVAAQLRKLVRRPVLAPGLKRRIPLVAGHGDELDVLPRRVVGGRARLARGLVPGAHVDQRGIVVALGFRVGHQ
jgi:hypothetical protein